MYNGVLACISFSEIIFNLSVIIGRFIQIAFLSQILFLCKVQFAMMNVVAMFSIFKHVREGFDLRQAERLRDRMSKNCFERGIPINQICSKFFVRLYVFTKSQKPEALTVSMSSFWRPLTQHKLLMRNLEV